MTTHQPHRRMNGAESLAIRRQRPGVSAAVSTSHPSTGFDVLEIDVLDDGATTPADRPAAGGFQRARAYQSHGSVLRSAAHVCTCTPETPAGPGGIPPRASNTYNETWKAHYTRRASYNSLMHQRLTHLSPKARLTGPRYFTAAAKGEQ